jgi:hypothetical protein
VLVGLAETESRDIPSLPAENLDYGGCWETKGDGESFIVLYPVPQVEFGSGFRHRAIGLIRYGVVLVRLIALGLSSAP